MSDSEIRMILLNGIEAALQNPLNARPLIETAFQEAQKVLNTEPVFSLKQLFWGRFVSLLGSYEFQNNIEVLTQVQQQLIGKVFFWGTTALKVNFQEILSPPATEALAISKTMIELLRKITSGNTVPDDIKQTSEPLQKQLRSFLYNVHQSETVADLLLANLISQVLHLPFDGSLEFDITDRNRRFGLIRAQSSFEKVSDHLRNLDDLIAKLEGRRVVFVDISAVSENFICNMR